MSNINFVKINGAGNDFILIDAISNSVPQLSSKDIKHMCDRRKGIGADGMLFIEKSKKADFNLIYYNSDGNLGSLCGNGSRCTIYYALNNFLKGKTNTKFACENEFYSGSFAENGLIKFDLKTPTNIRLNENINLDNENIRGHFINTGSPHLIIFWEDIKNLFEETFFEFDFVSFGREIRHSKHFSPDGTNVNVIFNENNKQYIRTYERGVEDETLACGTGTTAAALISYLVKGKMSPSKFITRDNDELIVDFEVKNKIFSKISLTGPVKINYIGTYDFQ